MKISYTSTLSNKAIVTGGHIYDRNFINVIDKKTDYQIENLVLDIKKWNSNLILAPFLYLFKSFKHSDSDIYIFNSVLHLRFILLPYFLKKSKHKRLMTIHHHFRYQEFKGFKRRFYKMFEWKFLDQMDNIIVPSPYIYDELLKVYPKEKLLLFQIPFDSDPRYEPNPIKGNLVFAGTIENRKGLKYLLQSLVILKNKGREYNLTIIGKVIEQEYYENLLRIVEENKLNVTFTGFISREDKDKFISEADVFVFPSLLEGYGMALVEAQVYGLPIVSFDNSAMPYNVKNDITGYAVETGNIEAYADAIEKIVENRELRESLSKGALENLKNQNTNEDFEKKIIRDFNKMRP